ncbi:MFS transporter [Streptomyces sp. GC420]|uniref:MFS transporter n=1 Tax=Streptomyces sp. GC420 TaxID=2697568 RepID=UPI001414DAD5|nr:MFS transporter [Streptomyces sp. GC420]NBM19866.1 hypothetical protein [Streptomyces sp. GC420]
MAKRLPGVPHGALPTADDGSLVALLRDNADFRRLFCASALGLTGDWLTFVALSSFVYRHTGSAGWTALLFAVNGLQLATPDHIRGRVMVLVFGLSSAFQGVSSLAAAPLAASVGLPDTTRLLAGLAVVYAIIWTIGVTRTGSARSPSNRASPTRTLPTSRTDPVKNMLT